MQDLNDKITGNSLTALEWNEVPSEIQNVIESLGISLSGGDLNQLGKAIAGYVANGSFYTDGGAVNAAVLSVIGSKQGPTAYTNGMEIRFFPVAQSTGAATVNVNGLGIKNIRYENGDVLSSGELEAGRVVLAYYNSGGAHFRLQNQKGSVSRVGEVALQSTISTSTVKAATPSIVKTANDAANAAQSTADGAVTDASTAQSAANAAQSTANTAVSDAAAAQSTANSKMLNWNLQANGGASTSITNNETINFANGLGMDINRSSNTITVGGVAAGVGTVGVAALSTTLTSSETVAATIKAVSDLNTGLFFALASKADNFIATDALQGSLRDPKTGIHIQWGRFNMLGGASEQTVPYVGAFANQTYIVMLTNTENVNNEGNTGRVKSHTASNFVLSNGGGNTSTEYFWLAIGS